MDKIIPNANIYSLELPHQYTFPTIQLPHSDIVLFQMSFPYIDNTYIIKSDLINSECVVFCTGITFRIVYLLKKRFIVNNMIRVYIKSIHPWVKALF